ncbi:MAG: SUMF1/EgtB/PvdO family nonheme iron enzyme, partial [Polyangiaceae bacterium]
TAVGLAPAPDVMMAMVASPRTPASSAVSIGRAVAEGPCPPEMALVGGSCIDRWEAHVTVTSADGSEAILPGNERPPDGARLTAASASGTVPQGHLTRHEAAAACDAGGKRLCRIEEWRAACVSGGGPFPYGAEEDRGRCNTHKEHLLPRVFGQRTGWDMRKHLNAPALNATPGFLALTGEHEGCVTPEGVYDLAGNLQEWVADAVSLELVRRLHDDGFVRHRQPWRPGNAIFVGGFYSTRAEHGPGCAYTTLAHQARYHDYSIGFRCCRDVRRAGDEEEPAAAALRQTVARDD